MNAETKTRTLGDTNFDDEVLKSDVPVLVDFWAPWCPPCKAIAPIVEAIAVDFAQAAKVGKVNVDENPALAQRYGIASIPTLLFFVDGTVVDRAQGAVPKNILSQELATLTREGSTTSH